MTTQQTRQEALEVVRNNIKSTIAKMRKSGTTRVSVDCLRQNTPTTGLTISLTPAGYIALFTEAAAGVSLFSRGFSITA